MVKWKGTQTDLSLNPGPASYKLGTLLSSSSPVYKMGTARPNLEGSGQENRKCESRAWHGYRQDTGRLRQ